MSWTFAPRANSATGATIEDITHHAIEWPPGQVLERYIIGHVGQVFSCFQSWIQIFYGQSHPQFTAAGFHHALSSSESFILS